VVGMIWQVALVVLPMYVVTWELTRAAIALAVVAITSLILKFTWYDHLKELEHINQYGRVDSSAPEPKLAAN